jgi:hypothetical protein
VNRRQLGPDTKSQLIECARIQTQIKTKQNKTIKTKHDLVRAKQSQ